MLSNEDLESLGQKMNIPLAENIGFKDNLPRKLKDDEFYITNLEDSEDERGNNGGTHWVSFQVRPSNNGSVNAVYYDSYGKQPPEIVKKCIRDTYGNIPIWHNKKDMQSLVADTCGYWCLAFGHYINDDRFRTRNIVRDAKEFCDFFEDLNHSNNWVKNEFLLKHFFLNKDEKLNKPITIPPQYRIQK